MQLHYGVIVPDMGLSCVPTILDDPDLAFIFCKLLDDAVQRSLRQHKRDRLIEHVHRLALETGSVFKVPYYLQVLKRVANFTDM